MSIGSLATEPAHGYLSEGSKRRFTLVAGILGAVFFLAQFLLPMLVMFLVMMPMMFEGVASMADLDQAALWKGELWLIERTAKVNWREPENSTSQSALRHLSLTDLESAGPAVPLAASKARIRSGQLLPVGERLWVIDSRQDQLLPERCADPVERGGARRSLVPTLCLSRPPSGRLAGSASLAGHLAGRGRSRGLDRKGPPPGPACRERLAPNLQAVESKGGLYLFAELCTDDPDRCSISYRQPDQETWLPLVEDSCSCATWTALPSESLPIVVLSERAENRETLSVITLTTAGPQRKPIALPKERSAWGGWRALTSEGRLVLLTQGMPGSLSLLEVADGRSSAR